MPSFHDGDYLARGLIPESTVGKGTLVRPFEALTHSGVKPAHNIYFGP